MRTIRKHHAVWALACLLLLPGCGVELLTTTAVRGELESQQMSAMKRQVQHAAGTTGETQLRKAIQTYQAEKGAYPPSLDVLAPDYLPQVPLQPDGTPYPYDPATGQLRAAAATPYAADYALMQQIRQAINRYGNSTGYYPAKLGDLAPGYLPTAPLTADGQAFVYDNQNGYLAHPITGLTDGEAAGHGAGAGRIPGGRSVQGGGPMGQAMTGIGMQQQLNGMRQGGASAAGSRMRQSGRNIQTQQNDRANQAMDDLGL